MTKKKKLMIVGPVLLLLIAGVAYKKVLAPKPAAAKRKIEGKLVALDPEFVVNLAGGRYAKVSVSVLSKSAPKAAEGMAPVFEQDSAIRSIVTDDLTGIDPDELVNRAKRATLLVSIQRDLKKQTDEQITRVFFTDIAVQ